MNKGVSPDVYNALNSYVMSSQNNTKNTTTLTVKTAEECELGAFVNWYVYDVNNYEVASGQLETDAKIIPAVKENEFADIKETESDYIAYGNGFSFTVSKNTGEITSMIKNGEEQLFAPLRITALRAPTDNERQIRQKWVWENVWEGENLDRQFDNVYSCILENSIVKIKGCVSGVSRAPYFRYELICSVFESGEMKLELNGNVRENCMWLPRLGFEFKLPYDTDAFEYFGRGPLENFCDMKLHAPKGIYKSCADNEYVNYVYPQEHGNHTGIKYLDVENALRFSSDRDFEMNVSHYDSRTLMAADHTDEIEKSDYTTVRIDYKCSGTASNSCGHEISEKNRLCEKHIEFTFFAK
jgi:beta-galactosidase